MYLKSAILLWIYGPVFAQIDRGAEIGCFAFNSSTAINTHTGQTVDVCLTACEQLYYRYILLSNDSTCFCGNSVGGPPVPMDSCNTPCPKNSSQHCGGDRVASVYDTGVTSPGPPREVVVTNLTETTARIGWAPPEAYSVITGYTIRATVLRTYASIVSPPKLWTVSNETFQYELLSLQPGTMYNISVSANSYMDVGPPTFVKAETEIGTPDPSPPEAKVVQRHGDKMVIHIPEAINDNGPVTFYRIVVSVEVYQLGYIPENLKDYKSAMEEGLPYYITAEIDPGDVKHDFIIGDGKTFNGYYNAPLPLTNDIDVAIGIVSDHGVVRKIRYADSSKKVIINVNDIEEVSGLVVALGAAIAISMVLLLIGIGLVIILRKKIQLVRAQRCSQSMPLSVSEPCIEIENSGYLTEEEEHIDHYSNLKRKLWNIPRNLIDIDISCVAGTGSYGKFTRGKVHQKGGHTQSLIQIIADRDLSRPDRRLMLHELDLLIKTAEHENVISLIGISETPTALLVVLQDSHQTLKELLVSSRHRDLQNNKFSLIAEARIIQMCSDVARGMEYIHNKKIMHKKLCSRNVVITDRGVPKVSGYGLSHIHPLNETPDYIRWTAHEILQQARFTSKADVWSFGCLLWEALTLGATPYAQVSSRDVAARVLRGLRPSQPCYVGDDLFQLCLQCWQMDPDERPNFSSVLREMESLICSVITGSLSFTYFNDFSYEPYIHNLEVV